ncbi:hypothetical protein K0M31_000622 [Melipona bicolor]|uniref:Uncharacterized protein n=1 Tax=Melipona bicolor TaxID=60889 RepID=A0AA40KX08_9HYME|nr:hypothetical protein K0M31_000622 [Melipona bicolor]
MTKRGKRFNEERRQEIEKSIEGMIESWIERREPSEHVPRRGDPLLIEASRLTHRKVPGSFRLSIVPSHGAVSDAVPMVVGGRTGGRGGRGGQGERYREDKLQRRLGEPLKEFGSVTKFEAFKQKTARRIIAGRTVLFESSGKGEEDKGDAEVVNEEKMSQPEKREPKKEEKKKERLFPSKSQRVETESHIYVDPDLLRRFNDEVIKESERVGDCRSIKGFLVSGFWFLEPGSGSSTRETELDAFYRLSTCGGVKS